MNRRLRLKNHVQPLRRGPGSVQLGLSPDGGASWMGSVTPRSLWSKVWTGALTCAPCMPQRQLRASRTVVCRP